VEFLQGGELALLPREDAEEKYLEEFYTLKNYEACDCYNN